jgi:hypothetical protein
MKIGDKVVCIARSGAQEAGESDFFDVTPNWPIVNEIYVIRNFNRMPEFLEGSGALTLELTGYKCISTDTGEELGFNASRFRLLHDIKKENYEDIKKMLDDCARAVLHL